ncbi:tryptophan synthase subunit alpha [Deinococcus radiophilus]|uniref:Tryptophan synthase alpha chain n=1 Tax=Deinococcus radiophilus TaxID=32062 RepID=A0A431VPN1_9DEIO|nr:tryptophan synthase subunit alpha [Deinococcus radiophilus]RTR24698.1 tryptophan synthase subunit alpha [Deinococcus radiophilus]UFA51625.1 tryptophan synthase subunit alpha [Deinococcus radiophilus]
MSRYETMFAALKGKGEGAFVPFVTLGDPNIEASERIVRALLDTGADALELGLPFSDPVADGPTIQAANIRALAAGAGLSAGLNLIRRVREDYPDVPVGLLVYANLPESFGLPEFYGGVAAVGVDSVLVADVPLREGARFAAAAQAAGVQPLFIAPPDASQERLAEIAQASQGYVYLLARAGVTGTEGGTARPAGHVIRTLKEAGAPPTLLGFGIAEPEHVRAALDAGADGAISGSAVVRLIEEHLEDEAAMLAALGNFVRRMKAATRLTD